MDDIRLLSSCSSKTERFCDFESTDICNYNTSLAQSDVKWQRGSRQTLSSGPLVDQYANPKLNIITTKFNLCLKKVLWERMLVISCMQLGYLKLRK